MIRTGPCNGDDSATPRARACTHQKNMRLNNPAPAAMDCMDAVSSSIAVRVGRHTGTRTVGKQSFRASTHGDDNPCTLRYTYLPGYGRSSQPRHTAGGDERDGLRSAHASCSVRSLCRPPNAIAALPACSATLRLTIACWRKASADISSEWLARVWRSLRASEPSEPYDSTEKATIFHPRSLHASSYFACFAFSAAAAVASPFACGARVGWWRCVGAVGRTMVTSNSTITRQVALARKEG
jgi:hypothetical protein